MKSFNIIALAALAFTAYADQIKATCKLTNQNGDDLGNIMMNQELNDIDETEGPSFVSFRTSDAPANEVFSMKIFESDGSSPARGPEQCHSANFDQSASRDLAAIKANRGGLLGVKNLVNRDLDLDLLDGDVQTGDYAALVQTDDDGNVSQVFACCTLRVRECPDREEE